MGLGGGRAVWSASEMLDGHDQSVDVPAHARSAHDSLSQKRLEDVLCRVVRYAPIPVAPDDPVARGTEVNLSEFAGEEEEQEE